MLTPTQISEVRSAAYASVMCESQTGIPAELTIAQWALESGWGSHQPGNNCFGIKYYEGAPGKQLLETKEWFTQDELLRWLSDSEGRMAEVIPSTLSLEPNGTSKKQYSCKDWFAAYNSLLSCFEAHANRILLKGVMGNFLGTYKITRALSTYISNVAEVYATDPDYASKILKIASMQEVREAVRQCRIQINRRSYEELK